MDSINQLKRKKKQEWMDGWMDGLFKDV